MNGPSHRITTVGEYSVLHYSGPWSPACDEVMRLESIDGVSALGFEPDSFEYLRRYPRLRFVAIFAERAADLAPIGALPALEVLRTGTRKRTKRAVDFPVFPKLRELATEGDPALGALLNNSHVRQLRVDGWAFADLETLSDFNRLERLDLSSSRKLDSLTGIGRLTSLNDVRLDHLSNLRSLDGIEGLTGLRRLAIDTCKHISSLEAVSALQSLERLAVNNSGEVMSLSPVAQLRRLRAFYATGSTRIADRDLSPLLALPRLSEFGMRASAGYQPAVKDVAAVIDARHRGR